MRTLTLLRESEIGDATLGRMVTPEGTTLCVTLEELWHDDNNDGLGDRNKSRIPAGKYKAFRRRSPARNGQELFELIGVPGRGNIQIHTGNTTKDTLGCILLGSKVTPNQPAIEGSRIAFEKFMAYFAGDDGFELVVEDVAA